MKSKKIISTKKIGRWYRSYKKILNWKPKISLEKGLNLVIKKKCI